MLQNSAASIQNHGSIAFQEKIVAIQPHCCTPGTEKFKKRKVQYNPGDVLKIIFPFTQP